MTANKKLWYYTTVNRGLEIIYSKKITTNENKLRRGLFKPGLWLTSFESLDPISFLDYGQDLGELVVSSEFKQPMACNFIRIGIHKTPSVISWNKYRDLNINSKKLIHEVEIVCKNHDAFSENWYVSNGDIAFNEWLQIEIWQSGTWQKLGDKY